MHGVFAENKKETIQVAQDQDTLIE